VIVDDVEKHHQAVTVRGIDERAQIVGAAVAALGREQQSAVVTPVAAAGKFRDRHQLDGGDTEPRQMLERGFRGQRFVRAAHRRGRPASPAGASDRTADQRRCWRRARHRAGTRGGIGNDEFIRQNAITRASPLRPRTSRRRFATLVAA
jgi:hypothetical protein